MESTMSAISTISGQLMTYSQFIDLLGIMVTWPGVILLIFVVLIFKIHFEKIHIKELCSLLFAKITHINTPWIGFDVSGQTTVKEDGKLNEKIDSIKREIQEQEESKHKEFISNKVIPLITSLQDKIEYERIWGVIFGGQLMMLQSLLVEGKDISVIKEMYDGIKAKFPSLFIDFENYIGFLLNNNLAIRVNDELRITTQGREFLDYAFKERNYTAKYKTL